MEKLRGALDEKSFKRFLLGHQKISKLAIEELGSYKLHFVRNQFQCITNFTNLFKVDVERDPFAKFKKNKNMIER